MTWETRPYQLRPNDHVMQQTSMGRLLGKRVRLTLDPRAYEADDANDLRVEGTVLCCTADGPMLILEERDVIDGGRFPLIDILVIEKLEEVANV